MVENTYAKNAIKSDFYSEMWLLKYSKNSSDRVELVPSKGVPLYHRNQALYRHRNQNPGTLNCRDHVRFTPTKKIADPTVKTHHRSSAINAKQKKFFEHIHRW